MFELDYNTKYLLVVIEFEYDSKENKRKFLPNNIREAFLGLEKGNPKVPKIMKEVCKYEREILFPIHFSLIKKPVKAEISSKKNYTIRNTAVGAMILYEFLGLFEDFKRCCIEFDKFLKEKLDRKNPDYFRFITDIKILLGYDLKDVTK